MQRTNPRSNFLLLFAFTIPFWALGALSERQLLPALPVSALAVVCPILAAAVLVYRQDGIPGVTALLKRSFDFGRMGFKFWLLPMLLIEPVIKALSFIVMRLTGMNVPLPANPPIAGQLLLLIFFIAGLGEELGWMGYAADPLQEQFGALKASLILGSAWAVWHFIPLLEAHRSLDWIAWWTLGTLASRVIIVWLYNNTGRSVFVAAFFHATINYTWQIFPVQGSFFDPRIDGLITAAVALIVVLAWGPRTMTGRKSALPVPAPLTR
jgi:uncharacterized protein